MGFLKIFFGLGLVAIIGLTPVYKNFKGKQLCLSLKNDQLNVEKIKKLEEYLFIVNQAVGPKFDSFLKFNQEIFK